jgi:hypothetical protein
LFVEKAGRITFSNCTGVIGIPRFNSGSARPWKCAMFGSLGVGCSRWNIKKSLTRTPIPCVPAIPLHVRLFHVVQRLHHHLQFDGVFRWNPFAIPLRAARGYLPPKTRSGHGATS